MEIEELDGADISLVDVSGEYPICKLHGAMNKVSKEGYWRCITTYKIVQDGSPQGRLIENACRAGFKERTT